MASEIYVVGMAAVYAGARDLREFWETVLTRRSGFREFPRQRLNPQDYCSSNKDDRDKTYVTRAALLDGFTFDWKFHRVPKSAFEATDPVHWLALSTAIRAIDDAGVNLDLAGRERIGVVLGNSLTGEVSRANLLRLRWPYVLSSLLDGAARTGINGEALAALIAEVERSFKSAFPAPNEDTLAGALSNVIAGRICNMLDFNGGGYVVDGACASSLLAVSAACEALEAGRLDMAVAGGVDISLDPLEMVGFARTGALTSAAMRVYDKDASGFLPGEGCGMLVLTTGEQMRRLGLRPWARIAGWGVSSDGAGGVTAPKASAQALAMRRCYQLCGFGAETLDFIEGHGTGTPVGDRQELLGFLEQTSGGRETELRQIGVTSIKTLLGHTKAAAGAAGLIKAVLAANQRILPPLAGMRTPADAFSCPGARIYPITRGACLPEDAPLRAGVSGAGFGGINCHVAVDVENIPKRPLDCRDPSMLLASAQAAELFVLSADDIAGLIEAIVGLTRWSSGMAEGELVDLAVACALRDQSRRLRAAAVAGSVEELRGRLAALAEVLQGAAGELPPAPPGTLLGVANPRPRIGFLFPGQGSQFIGMGGGLAERSKWAVARRTRWDAEFAGLGANGLTGFIDRPLHRADSSEVTARWSAELRDTRVAQPAIVMTELQWLQWLRQIGVTPSAVAGHSLGEISAMVAANLLSEAEAMELVRIRAEACAAGSVPDGGMLALKCGLAAARKLVASAPGFAVIANDNAPDQVVAAGDAESMLAIAELARDSGVEAMALNVSKAFHTLHMAGAAEALRQAAAGMGEERTAAAAFFSGLHGGASVAKFDPVAYLVKQITAPVRFREMVSALAGDCDLMLEIGPGAVLTGLARRVLGKTMPVCALEPGPGEPGAQFCAAIGQLFVAGADLDWEAFYANRYWRPFIPAWERKFIENPCSRLAAAVDATVMGDAQHYQPGPAPRPASEISNEASVEEVIRALVVLETGYDHDMIQPGARLANDLNLDSIKIAELRAELRRRGIELPADLPLGATPLGEIAAAAKLVSSPAAASVTSGEPPARHAPLPENLPVLGYLQAWTQISLTPVSGLRRVRILHAAERGEEAEMLAKRLAVAGVEAILDREPAWLGRGDIEADRLIVLPGGRASIAEISKLFARAGELIAAGVDSVVFATRGDLTPVFGFAQSLSLEMPNLPILAAEAEAGADLHGIVVARIETGVRPCRVGADNSATAMGLAVWRPPQASSIPLLYNDVVVISGGAKGITAECALALLKTTRARGLLLGTSAEDAPGAEITGALSRMAAENLQAVYIQCDVTDPESVRSALRRGTQKLGASEIAGLVHGAGVNTPALAAELDPAKIRRDYAVKVGGLRNLLNEIGAERLKLCVALGSVIGALGLPGNSGYALANDALAAELAHLKAEHPGMRVACPAYSVWSEVGMGAKLNVLEFLQNRNIAPIPIDEGVRWFLACCGVEAPLPLVIAGSMHGLATWRQARGTDKPAGLPYCDGLVAHEPGLFMVARAALNPRRDTWMHDHVFRGALLFPTVQALTAIAAGAALLARDGRMAAGFTNLRISRPIIAAQHGDTIVEIDVRRGMDREWTGRVKASGGAWDDADFEANCVIGPPGGEMPPPCLFGNPGGGWRPVAVEAGAHLYDSILFQRGRFQSIDSLQALDLSDPVRRKGRFILRRGAAAANDPIPDAFFLDAMLQCLQVLVPRDLCLPVGIEEICFFEPARDAGMTIVEAEITEKTGNGYITRVRAWNAGNGAAVACYEGYRVSIIETRASRLDVEALFDPLAADRDSLAVWLASNRNADCFSVALGSITDAGQDSRRSAAAEQIAVQLGVGAVDLSWRADGAPRLAKGLGQGVSIAHDADRLLTVCGTGRVGCDIQRAGRGAHPWGEILPVSRAGLWRELTAAMHDLDLAGALVWAIHEALIKAGAADASVGFAGLHGGQPRFELSRDGVLIAGVLELALLGQATIALVRLPEIDDRKELVHFSRDFKMTFKEALPPLKSPTAPVFYAWMGELREEAMSDIGGLLASAFGEGGKGMVTNGTRLRVARPVRFAASLRAWVWLNKVLTSQPSTFELGFQFVEIDPVSGQCYIVAEGEQRLTWVDVGPLGQVRVEPFPAFFAEFIAERLPPPGSVPFTPPLGRMPEQTRGGILRWRRGAEAEIEHGVQRLKLDTDETHSNFVGNIYFTHAATLADRACQKALRRMGTCSGGFFATLFQLDHLGEAMPGDILEAEVRLTEVGGDYCGFDLYLFNQSHGGARIAAGRARYQLFDTAAVDAEPQPAPDWLIPTFIEETL